MGLDTCKSCTDEKARRTIPPDMAIRSVRDWTKVCSPTVRPMTSGNSTSVCPIAHSMLACPPCFVALRVEARNKGLGLRALDALRSTTVARNSRYHLKARYDVKVLG